MERSNILRAEASLQMAAVPALLRALRADITVIRKIVWKLPILEKCKKRISVWKECDVGTWNYRVIEFITPSAGAVPEERWRAIHEVYYDEYGRPNGYTASPAVIQWNTEEGDSAPFAILEFIKEALAKPVLMESDFYPGQVAINGCASTQKTG